MRVALLLFLTLPTVALAQGEQALDSLTAADYDAVVAMLHAGQTDVDYRRGRFAYALTPGYDPYDVEAGEEVARLNDLLFETDDPAAALLVADSVLAANYLSLDGHHRSGVAHERLGNAERAAFHFSVFQGLMDSILRTATGRRDDPYIVNQVHEEYVTVAVLGLEVVGQGLLSCTGTPCDEMTLRDPDGPGEVTLYFDVSIPYGHMRRQMGRRE